VKSYKIVNVVCLNSVDGGNKRIHIKHEHRINVRTLVLLNNTVQTVSPLTQYKSCLSIVNSTSFSSLLHIKQPDWSAHVIQVVFN